MVKKEKTYSAPVSVVHELQLKTILCGSLDEVVTIDAFEEIDGSWD